MASWREDVNLTDGMPPRGGAAGSVFTDTRLETAISGVFAIGAVLSVYGICLANALAEAAKRAGQRAMRIDRI